MFLDKFIYFGKNLGDQVKDRSPINVKSLIEVPYVAHLKVQVIHFVKNLGEQVMCRSPRKLKSLIEVPYVAHLTVLLLILNMNLFYSP